MARKGLVRDDAAVGGGVCSYESLDHLKTLVYPDGHLKSRRPRELHSPPVLSPLRDEPPFFSFWTFHPTRSPETKGGLREGKSVQRGHPFLRDPLSRGDSVSPGLSPWTGKWS